MSVGNKIKVYLTENNIKQVWLSQETRLPIPKLNAMLNEKRKISVEEYKEIMNILKLPVEKFLK